MIPEHPVGVVVFAHGVGSSRQSPGGRGPWSRPPTPGAIHLFEEPETLEPVAVLGRDWFTDHPSRVAVGARP